MQPKPKNWTTFSSKIFYAHNESLISTDFGIINLISVIMKFLLFADNWQELVQRIKSKGMKPGVSLKPGTPIEEVYPLVYLHYRIFISFISKIHRIFLVV